MKPFLVGISLVLFLFSCSEKPHEMQLTFEVIPEDYERGFYAVTWEDTLGQGIGITNPIDRPYEIWCVIKNLDQDTLGYYTGQSTPMAFSYFQAKDSVVLLYFMVGPNVFTTFPEILQQDMGVLKQPIIFDPVEVNILTDLRQPTKVELTETF